jgi:hypothetical protein
VTKQVERVHVQLVGSGVSVAGPKAL